MLQITPKEIIGLVTEFAANYAAAWNTIEGMKKEHPNLPIEKCKEVIESKTITILTKLEQIALDHYKLLCIYNKISLSFNEKSIESLFMDEFNEEITSYIK